MDFKNVPENYRPVPFWSWNDKLNPDETKRQIELMKDVGIGGFFMHARGGLLTEYMGDEWFLNVKTAIDSAKKNNMSAWAYDENGWPSGFGNGAVNALGVEYQQKYLRMSEEKPKENIISKCGEHWFYYEVNPFYVDTLDKNVVAEFIKKIYCPYIEKFSDSLEGFFTDEPQISRDGIPWSFVFWDEYKKRYNEDINEHLEELFLPVYNYKETRVKFWKMVTELFSESYMKQIYDKCEEAGVKLTGHLLLEETLNSQLTTNGACMPHYEYFHIPGMDWLCRPIYDCLTPIQLSSVCDQLGKKFALSETYAACGHNVSFSELKGIYEWQMVHGVNLLCQHLEGYSLRGIRKRDYPPAMFYQQPWWSEYKLFIDAMSREGMVLADAEKYADILVLHPQTTAWSMYDSSKAGNENIKNLNDKFMDILISLEKKHIMYHLGDEIILKRHAKVENGKLIVGEQSYSYIIASSCEIMLPETKRLIDNFIKSGGKIINEEEIQKNNVCDSEEITYLKKSNDEYTVHYFVNTSSTRKTAAINVKGRKLDIISGELLSFGKDYEFEPWGSLMVIEEENPYEDKKEENIINLNGEFEIISPVKNAIMLDYCDYYFDGELQEKNGFVLNISQRANKLERPVKIHQEYKVKADYIPNELYLVCENPNQFEIKINGKPLIKDECGYFVDMSFKKLEVSDCFIIGENTISFDCEFCQNEKLYESIKKAYLFESERNKLNYDMEIEPIYLVGEFSLKTDGIWENSQNKSVGYSGEFVLEKPVKRINVKNIEKQGFPFFAGEMELEGEIDIIGENLVLELDIKGINAVRVQIQNKTKVMIFDNKLPLSSFNKKGKTKIRLTLINNLRNLLGPHHLEPGEILSVTPAAFYKEPCIWSKNGNEPWWREGYSFVETGI